ncbi:hypothetical protein GCM10017643_27130 [Ancylobacter dichloromethanicus]|uniref:Uncharacterized protein n=2 Tax=Ancylobacter dichloromethanicus TaxID=518825 RepID=A0A9W6N033_9HYPH|nr:hypothetical protein GCM10017643_27130 [Ancylobacter dichloromethanicus]
MFTRYQGLWAMVLRNGEAGAGAGAAGAEGGGAGAGAGAGGEGGAGAAGAAGGGAADPWKRDFIPESMYGATPEETFGKLADAWKGLREGESKRPQPGKSAEDYTFDASKNEKIAPYFKDAASDPFLKVAQEVALKVGMPKEHFGAFVTQLYEQAVDNKLLGPVYSPETEARTLAQRLAPGKSWDEAKPIVAKAQADAVGFTDVLGQQLKLSDGAKALLGALADEADGVEMITALSGAMKQVPGFALPGVKGGDTGGWTKESLDKAMTDPRANPYAREYDKDFRARIDAGFRQLHGN